MTTVVMDFHTDRTIEDWTRRVGREAAMLDAYQIHSGPFFGEMHRLNDWGGQWTG
ncbi:MAG: hypothetical protein WCB27_21290 [Thermoguttaceae bacterium]